MRKIIGFIVTMFLFTTNIYAQTPTIDTSHLSEGYITVTAEANMVVQISKGGDKYNYTLSNSEPTNFPLQLGNGSYKILVLEKVSANQYTAKTTKDVTLDVDQTEVFLNSIQLVDFNGEMISIEDLTELVSQAATDIEKTELLYEYILNSMSYDFNKAGALANATNYLPVNDTTYTTEQGICYDMSSLFASVLRYNDVPTKLIMGYTPNVSTYHAWNEVYYDNEWHVIDVTYDVGVVKANLEPTMIKSTSDYSATKAY